MESTTKTPRAQWDSRIGFILAAAGSAVGLGNIWKFPYITGENGGGAFVLVYLLCILLVGVPVMIAEVLLGRTTRSSPVGAFRSLAPRSPWMGIGIMGVGASFLLMSYYSTVAGWALHFTYLSLTDSISGVGAEHVQGLFGDLTGSAALGLGWQFAFLLITIGVVVSGVSKGIERCSRIMMPGLFVLLLVLLGKAMTLSGWGEGMQFLYGMHFHSLTPEGVLEALGHSFFTLSLGMGVMLTYGSYVSDRDDLVGASVATAGADTLVALVAAMVIFPVVFTFGLEPGAGPGLLFVTVPTALAQMTGGTLLAIVFFFLLVFGALTSGISMMETVTAYLIDDRGMSRRAATLLGGAVMVCCGIPATLSAAWFGGVDYLVSNWLLPLGGLGIALFVAWKMDGALRSDSFAAGSSLARFYKVWLWALKYPVPVCMLLVFLHAIGIV